MSALRVTCGTLRALTREEKKQWCSEGYCWVVETPYKYECGDVCITVPVGFLTDGSTGGPDYGCSWLFHDWLYATHCFDPAEPSKSNSSTVTPRRCTRAEADEIMRIVLENERQSLYLKVFNMLSEYNFGYCFSRAWTSSGKRGPQFLNRDPTDEEKRSLALNDD